jgi:hypothetical protein
MQTSARRSISRLMTNSAFEKFSNFPRGGRRPWRPHAPPTGGRKSAPASTCIRCPGCCTLRCVHATTITKGHATTTFLNGGVSGEWARPKQFSPEEVCADFFIVFLGRGRRRIRRTDRDREVSHFSVSRPTSRKPTYSNWIVVGVVKVMAFCFRSIGIGRSGGAPTTSRQSTRNDQDLISYRNWQVETVVVVNETLQKTSHKQTILCPRRH